jgi:uncharacterized protein YcfL
MKRLITILTLSLLVGCSSMYRMSEVSEIQDIPDDCYNRNLMIKWLSAQLEYGKPLTESQKVYDAKISAIQRKIWHLRYTCNPV